MSRVNPVEFLIERFSLKIPKDDLRVLQNPRITLDILLVAIKRNELERRHIWRSQSMTKKFIRENFKNLDPKEITEVFNSLLYLRNVYLIDDWLVKKTLKYFGPEPIDWWAVAKSPSISFNFLKSMIEAGHIPHIIASDPFESPWSPISQRSDLPWDFIVQYWNNLDLEAVAAHAQIPIIEQFLNCENSRLIDIPYQGSQNLINQGLANNYLVPIEKAVSLKTSNILARKDLTLDFFLAHVDEIPIPRPGGCDIKYQWAKNPEFTPEFLITYIPDISLYCGRNPNITWNFVEKFINPDPRIYSNKQKISCSAAYKKIGHLPLPEKYPKVWNQVMNFPASWWLALNLSDLEYLLTLVHPEDEMKPWYSKGIFSRINSLWECISWNRNITLEFIMAHQEKPWDWNAVIANKFKNYQPNWRYGKLYPYLVKKLKLEVRLTFWIFRPILPEELIHYIVEYVLF